MKLLVTIIMFACSISPAMATAEIEEDLPIMYLQPHGQIETMVLWRTDKPRRTIKRGVIATAVLDVASNVLLIVLGRRK